MCKDNDFRFTKFRIAQKVPMGQTLTEMIDNKGFFISSQAKQTDCIKHMQEVKCDREMKSVVSKAGLHC